MKQCPVCGREVLIKRKDAGYCKDPACRKKAHQSRKEQTAALPLASSHNKASVVVTFPDGSRWLLELSPLQGTAQMQTPSLTQVNLPAAENRSGSDPTFTTTPMLVNAPAAPAVRIPAISSEPIPQAMTEEIAPTKKPDDNAVPVPVAPTPEPAWKKTLKTIELYFTDQNGRRLSFREAVRPRLGEEWSIRSFAKAQLGLSRSDGYGLGGLPGRWRDVYRHHSPTEFGFDVDIAVLYADEYSDRACAAEPGLLKQALGVDWRAVLRTAAEKCEVRGI